MQLPTQQAFFPSSTAAADPTSHATPFQLPAVIGGMSAGASGAGVATSANSGAAAAGSSTGGAGLRASTNDAAASGGSSWDPVRRAALSRESELYFLKESNRALREKVTELEDVVELVEVEGEARRRQAATESARTTDALKLQIAFKVREAEDSEAQRLAASRGQASAEERVRALEVELTTLRAAFAGAARQAEDAPMEDGAAAVSATGSQKTAPESSRRAPEGADGIAVVSKGSVSTPLHPPVLQASSATGDTHHSRSISEATVPRTAKQRVGAMSLPPDMAEFASRASLAGADEEMQSRLAASAALERATLRASMAEARVQFSRSLLVDGLFYAGALARDVSRLTRAADAAPDSDDVCESFGENSALNIGAGAGSAGSGGRLFEVVGAGGRVTGTGSDGTRRAGGSIGVSGDDALALTSQTQTYVSGLTPVVIAETGAYMHGAQRLSPRSSVSARDRAVYCSLAARCAVAFRDASLPDSLAAVAETLRTVPYMSSISLSALRVSSVLLKIADVDLKSASVDESSCTVVNMAGFMAAAAEDENAPVRHALAGAAANAISTIVPTLVSQAFAATPSVTAAAVSQPLPAVSAARHAVAWLSLGAQVFCDTASRSTSRDTIPSLCGILRASARALRVAFSDMGVVVAPAILEAGAASDARTRRSRTPSNALDAAHTAAKLGATAARALAVAAVADIDGGGSVATAATSLGALSVAIEVSSYTIACASGDASHNVPALHEALLACAEMQVAAFSAALAIAIARGLGRAGPWALLSLLEVAQPLRATLPELASSSPLSPGGAVQRGAAPAIKGAASGGSVRFGLGASDSAGAPSSAGAHSPSPSPLHFAVPSSRAPIVFSQSRDPDAAALLPRVALAVAARVAESARLREALSITRDDAEVTAQLCDPDEDEDMESKDGDLSDKGVSAFQSSLWCRLDALARAADACVSAGAALLSIAHRHANGTATLIVSDTERVAIAVPNLHATLRLAGALVAEYSRVRDASATTDDAVAILAGLAGTRAQQDALSAAALVRGLADVPTHMLDVDARVL